jgi:hypothetical protein
VLHKSRGRFQAWCSNTTCKWTGSALDIASPQAPKHYSPTILLKWNIFGSVRMSQRTGACVFHRSESVSRNPVGAIERRILYLRALHDDRAVLAAPQEDVERHAGRARVVRRDRWKLVKYRCFRPLATQFWTMVSSWRTHRRSGSFMSRSDTVVRPVGVVPTIRSSS